MARLSVHLVTWNGNKYYPYLFESLKKQTYRDWSLHVWDNASEKSADLEAFVRDVGVSTTFTKSAENLGFAGGHNKLYAQTDSEYFVLLNQDFSLAPDCLEKLVVAIDALPGAAVVSPRLMKWDFANQIFTNTIDSLGLQVFRSRRVVELGGGEEWQDVGEVVRPVFGVSGAMPLFRRAAIKTIEFSPTEFFDNLYQSYKEDVDLAFRLQSAGYPAYVVTDAVVWHDRSAAGPRELSDSAAAENKRSQSYLIKYHSYKNHLLTLYKNEYWQNLVLDLPWILWYEFKKWLWYFLHDWSVLKSHREIWRLRNEMKQKRNLITSKRIVAWKKIRVWWT